MKSFINDDFLLQSETAKKLYHEHAEKQPIIDYHCHLSPKMIAENYRFSDLTEIWLGGDHYKWRAMRANGIPEEYITGNKPSFDKFMKWAETMPYALRNPLYHWTHLELKRIFGIDTLLNPATAREIYDRCTEMLRTDEFRAQSIMERMKVEVVCTTDDPADTLEYHRQIADGSFSCKVLPTWRPDKAMAVENPGAYNDYLLQLGRSADIEIRKFDHLLEALYKRHDFFASVGCKVSDHGLDTFYAEDFTAKQMTALFEKVRAGHSLNGEETALFKSGMLYEFARMDNEKGWVQQFHVGAIRNNNTKMFKALGPDTGYDAIADVSLAVSMNKFFDRLNTEGILTKTILYNLNPRDNELMVTNAYNFNDGSVSGKMQFGSGWWFLDQRIGMENQLNALSMLGLLSRFVGMLTDSRSFISYPRHEYFRRILCNLIGKDVEQGEMPEQELPFIGQMIENISYYNAKNYFGL
ncbi:MAG: glucuronate isomerase [Bacteroidales bacterium]|nr:glucuronate isomerase [Bacteroidales bacterium]